MSEGEEVGLTAAGDFADLVLHVLAQVEVPGPGNGFDPRYVSWADAYGLALEDDEARAIAASWDDALHRLPLLFEDVAALSEVAARPLAELRTGDDAVREALQRVEGPGAELVFATLGVLAPRWAAVHAEVIAPTLAEACAATEAWLAIAVELCPGLAARQVELSWALGPRGRGYGERIVVGAAVGWNAQAPELSAVLALHEHAVLEADGGYAQAEWAALTANAARLRGGPLEAAYAGWLGTLDLRPLLHAAELAGRITHAQAEGLRARADDRLASLAELAQSLVDDPDLTGEEQLPTSSTRDGN